MIDTHIWVWWVQGDTRLTAGQAAHIVAHQPTGLWVSVWSVMEVARLDAVRRITLPRPIHAWVRDALAYPGVRLADFTPEVAIAASNLPEPFHRDPADRVLVATARTLGVPLLTADARILAYPHVRCLS